MLTLSMLLIAGAQPDVPTPAPGGLPRQLAGSISDADYPRAALAAEEQGTVRVQLSIDRSGAVSGCQVIASSGSAVLDATTCSLMQERYRYAPARNRRGRSMAAQVTRGVSWRRPADVPGTPGRMPFARWEMRIAAAEVGGVRRCATEIIGIPGVIAGLCRRPGEVPMAQLQTDPDARMIVTSLLPQGETEAGRPLIGGRLTARATSEIEIAADGTLTSCHDLAQPDGVESLPTICSVPRGTLSPFTAAPPGTIRRARYQLEVYQLGMPEA